MIQVDNEWEKLPSCSSLDERLRAKIDESWATMNPEVSWSMWDFSHAQTNSYTQIQIDFFLHTWNEY